MPTSKLIRKLFKLRVKTNVDDDDKATSSHPVQSSSIPEPSTTQQLHGKQTAETTKSSSTRPTSRLSFLSLPGEVRNQIYAYTTYPSLTTIDIFQHASIILSLPIFHICRQIRHEAVSYLCASKTIHLSGIGAANDFFAAIGDHGIASLRHLVVRCQDAWHEISPQARVKKEVFLTHLKLATRLQLLSFIVGRDPLSREDVLHLKFAHMAGARFLNAVRNVVDRVDGDEGESPIEDKMDRLVDAMGQEQAVEHLRAEHAQGEKRKHVFRLIKTDSTFTHELDELELPSQMPAPLHMGEDERSGGD